MTENRDTRRNRTAAVFLALIVGLSAVVGAVGVAFAAPSDDLDFESDDPAPNPYVSTTLTKAEHPMSEGVSADAIEGYYDDNGDWVDDPVFVVNTTESVSDQSTMNKYTFDPAYIADDDRGEFPQTNDESGDNTASILDASEWNQQSGTPTISDAAPASGVEGVNLDLASTEVASYANWSTEYDTDESKRVFQVAGEMNSMDAATDLNISLEDESGDVKTFQVDPDDSQSTDITTAFGSQTGTFAYQVKLSNLPFDSGSGTWDNIQSVNITASGGAADITLTWLAFDKKTKTTFGERAVDDADDDSDYDQRNETYNSTDTVSIHDLGTLDSEFDDASLTDLQFPAKFPVSELQGDEGEEDDYVYEFENASQYPSYDSVLIASYRLELPAQIDLSYSTNDLKLDQMYPDDRYLELGHELNVANDANLSQASLTDDTGDLSSGSGDTVKLHDSGVNSDEEMIVHYEVLLTGPEVDSVMGGTDDGGAAAPPSGDSGGGGIVAFLMSPLGIIGTIAGFFGLGRWQNWF